MREYRNRKKENGKQSTQPMTRKQVEEKKGHISGRRRDNKEPKLLMKKEKKKLTQGNNITKVRRKHLNFHQLKNL